MLQEITFYILAGIGVIGSILVVSREKSASSFLFFALALLAVSGIFLQLHAPLMFAAQLVTIACALIALILFAVEVSRLDVALDAEYLWRSQAAAVAVTAALLVEIALTLLQRHFLPGEDPAIFIPRNPANGPLAAVDVLKFLFGFDLLPLMLLLFIVLITLVGIGVVFQKRAPL